ncbi:MAG: carboxypeptidase-like regulatory domain-containing protein [Rikenellaceae bacterium]
MKRYFVTLILIISAATMWGQGLKTISGKTIDSQSGDKIAFATVWVQNTEISVVSNGDGYFSIKVPDTTFYISFKQIGYELLTMKVGSRETIARLNRAPIIIDDIYITGGNPLTLLRDAIFRTRFNYPSDPMSLVGFYREMIQKDKKYVSIAEVITDIYKSPITQPYDRAKIYKGRRSSDFSRVDTIMMHYQGGISTALALDVAKNYENIFLSADSISTYYDLSFGAATQIQGRDQYVVIFTEKDKKDDIYMFDGKICIDRENLGISRCEFSCNVAFHPYSYRSYVVKLPMNYKITMNKANYIIDYLWDGSKWNYNYSKTDIGMNINAPKRKFTADYNIISEMVVTDRTKENVRKFKTSERIKSTELVFDAVVNYLDPVFWEGFNIIEPERSLESAVKKINRRIEIK